MKKSLFKAIIYNFISAVLIVNFDAEFTNNVIGFGNKISYSPVVSILMLFHTFVISCFLFVIFKLMKIEELKFKNSVGYFILTFSFISLVCTGLSLLVFWLSDNLVITKIITSVLYMILDMWALNYYLNKFNLSKKKKYTCILIAFLYFLILFH